ncbi:ABC transporter ATP-binding protein [Primorskyibacter sp. 2E107]|uniref:ABC transporter ATP-binding protein n=1 Tax=Primorskyibacter sp. 2E107 TaxID=3403458 RepID=UPI003AF4C51F
MTLLSVQSLTATYGASQALFGVDLDIAEGEVVALMGRNGMGKSTTVKCICRMMAAQGRLIFAGRDLHGLKSHQAAQLGIGLVPEGRRCFADLTVLENLIATARPGHWNEARVGALFPRLTERRDQVARSLSGGEQQMLAIGRALMTNPRLLVLDEATEGLAPIVRQEIWAALTRLKQQTGMAMLIIDKSLRELGTVADRAVIVERGRSVWDGTPEQITEEIAERYLGV